MDFDDGLLHGVPANEMEIERTYSNYGLYIETQIHSQLIFTGN